MEWAHLVTRHQTRLKVTLPKPTKGSRFGFMMRTDVHRVFVRTVDPGSAAAPLLLPFDELLSINGQKCVSTVQAAQLFGAAPKGKVDVEVSRPAALEGAVHRIQTCLRNALARRLGFGVVRRVLFKPERDRNLGVSFDAQWAFHSVISRVDAGGLACGLLREVAHLPWLLSAHMHTHLTISMRAHAPHHAHVHARVCIQADRLVRVNGVSCAGQNPLATARRLRESVGRIELMLVPAAHLDAAELRRSEHAACRARAERAVPTSDEAPECSICLSSVREPVFWPSASHGCEHLFCRQCVRKWTAHRAAMQQKPCCPLCRAPAWPEQYWRGLEVDEHVAELLAQRYPQCCSPSIACLNSRSSFAGLLG